MDIKFDKKAVDTTVAEEYINNHEELLELYEDYDGTIMRNYLEYGIYVFDGKQFVKPAKSCYHRIWNRELTCDPNHNFTDEEIAKKIRDLASLLNQNAILIAQIEYYTRDIPIEDTYAQLNLVIQHIRCNSQTQTRSDISDSSGITTIAYNDTLLKFRGVMDEICYSDWAPVLVCSYKEVAVISHLFVKLCHEVGLHHIRVEYKVGVNKISFTWQLGVRGLDSGTLAIISEDADLDSAVDKLLFSSKMAPWYLRRILVQESVYTQFKDALRWKCDLKKDTWELDQVLIKPSDISCAESLNYNGRIFLIDPATISETYMIREQFKAQSIVTVEAYRTTKEMLSMLQKDETRYLSLWMNDIALINEVTHTTTAPLTWVNNLADFRGPPQVSEAVFSHVFDTEIRIKKCSKIAKLCELLESWLKLNLDSRRDILCDVLEKYKLTEPISELYKNIKLSLSRCEMRSFVDVGEDYVCVGISNPVGVIGIDISERYYLTVETFVSLLQGNAIVIYESDSSLKQESLLETLEQAGVPIVDVGSYSDGNFSIRIPTAYPHIVTRAIWTYSGTSFAN